MITAQLNAALAKLSYFDCVVAVHFAGGHVNNNYTRPAIKLSDYRRLTVNTLKGVIAIVAIIAERMIKRLILNYDVYA